MILVIFGSESDKHVYETITKKLDEFKIEYDLEIASAHRTPELIDEILKKKYKLIIAGAGLAAHLPGVIASKTLTPIIGVPVKSVYFGLDAMLSIMQMPPGIPVMSVGVDKSVEAANQSNLCLKKYDKINVVGDEEDSHVMKCISFLKKLEIKYDFSETIDENAINIHFIPLDEEPKKKDALVVYCPILYKDDIEAEAALSVLKHSSHGLWVGLNNYKNAAISAIQILAIHHRLEDKLLELRKKGKQKILEARK